jgi:hypothetical protein
MNLLTATVHRTGVSSMPSPQTMSFPVDEVFIQQAADSTNTAINSFIEHRGKKFYCQETVSELVAAVGSGLVQISATVRDGRAIPATDLAFPLEDCTLSDVGSGTATVEYKGKKYYAAAFSFGGAPFTGTAAGLRDKLAGEVFNAGVPSVATYAALTASTASGLFKVTSDETNGGEATYYIKDGNTISWLPTQTV